MDTKTVPLAYVARGAVLVLACSVAAVHWWRSPSSVVVIVLAVLAAAIWAALGATTLSNAVWEGMLSQDLTWYAHRRPEGPAVSDEPRSKDTEFLVGQMRTVEERVQDFLRETDMTHISLAVTGGWLGLWHEAASIRSGTSGHIDLGYFWLWPDRSTVLPYTLEHELAHLHRNDARTRLAITTVRTALIVLCAGFLPLSHAALALVALAAIGSGYRWWVELACDRAAALHCGRDVAIETWKQDLADARQVPLIRRMLSAALALRSHPPMMLRLWWARCTPAPAGGNPR
ncbi:hypothetical protein [Streptomyces sp. NPDC093097]|uniref:hypothetical protein n=1 Tax=Streptomyces sp. NPDC093097 TaxID=3366027 RepID=UPI0038005AB1